MISGSLESKYNSKKKYYTTLFNIDALLKQIESVGGQFERKLISHQDGQILDFDTYRKTFDSDDHRNGSYLTLFGEWK